MTGPIINPITVKTTNTCSASNLSLYCITVILKPSKEFETNNFQPVTVLFISAIKTRSLLCLTVFIKHSTKCLTDYLSNLSLYC
jgi:hypothetical protein